MYTPSSTQSIVKNIRFHGGLLQLVFIAVCVASENVGFARLVFTPAMPLYIQININANPGAGAP
jgi:hypothetical protein